MLEKKVCAAASEAIHTEMHIEMHRVNPNEQIPTNLPSRGDNCLHYI